MFSKQIPKIFVSFFLRETGLFNSENNIFYFSYFLQKIKNGKPHLSPNKGFEFFPCVFRGVNRRQRVDATELMVHDEINVKALSELSLVDEDEKSFGRGHALLHISNVAEDHGRLDALDAGVVREEIECESGFGGDFGRLRGVKAATFLGQQKTWKKMMKIKIRFYLVLKKFSDELISVPERM